MIEFVNIKTNERIQLTRPHQIGAYINSSDLSPNATKGQDFGWRLAPEIVIQIEEMSQDPELLDKIASKIGVGIEDITTIHLVQYISAQEDLAIRTEESRKARTPEFKSAYEAEIDKLKKSGSESVEITKPIVKKK